MRAATVAALIAGVVGCYAPAYRDCEVGCASGVCPSGLMCDQALGVCRLEGAGSACPAVSGDAATDSVLAQDAPRLTYCTELTTAAFCEDFDRGSLEQGGWMVVNAGSGTVALVPSTRSAPSTLESFTPAHAQPMLTQGRVSRTLSLLQWQNKLTVSFDVFVAQRENATGPKGAFTIRAGTSFVFDIATGDAQQFYVILNSDPLTQTYVGISQQTWHRFDIVIGRVPGSTEVSVSVSVDGVNINASGTVGRAPAPPADTQYELHVGLAGTTANGICRFRYENIVVTVL